MAMQGIEAFRVRFQIEAINLNNVPFVLHFGIAEGCLILECFRSNELHGLQMRVEGIDNGQRDFKYMF